MYDFIVSCDLDGNPNIFPLVLLLCAFSPHDAWRMEWHLGPLKLLEFLGKREISAQSDKTSCVGGNLLYLCYLL